MGDYMEELLQDTEDNIEAKKKINDNTYNDLITRIVEVNKKHQLKMYSKWYRNSFKCKQIERTIEDTVNYIISEGNIYQIFHLLEIGIDYYIDKDTIEEKIIESGNPLVNYQYALRDDCERYNDHIQAIIDSKDDLYNYLAVKDLKSSRIDEHEQVVIDGGIPVWNFNFMQLEGAKPEAHKDIVMNYGDLDIKIACTKLFGYDNLEQLTNYCIATGTAEQCYRLARDVKGVDIKALADIVIESKDAELNYEFAKDVEGADIRRHEQVVLDKGDPMICCLFAKNIKDADTQAHGEIIFLSNNTDAKSLFIISTGATITISPKIQRGVPGNKNDTTPEM